MLEEIVFFGLLNKNKKYPQYQNWTQIHKSKLVYVQETSKLYCSLIHYSS
jgi:hypothetical protein